MNKYLAKIPNAAVIDLPEALECFRTDESHIIGDLPLAVVKPKGPDALRALVSVAKGEGLTLVPRGTGTGKAGGALPVGASIVVDLSEYPGELKASPEAMALRAPASVFLRDAKSAASEKGLFYPPDPNSWDQCSFGGSLATNAGGPCACKYGVTRHWVLSVDALMEDGEIHRFGVEIVKNNAGPNMTQLLVGSEGIFGIITSAAVRLIPAPKERVAMLLPVSSWGDLLGLPSRLVGGGLVPSALEFWDPQVLQHLRQFGPEEAKSLPGEALAILEFDDAGCTGEKFLGDLMDFLGPLAEHAQAAKDERQREAVWAVRRQTSTMLKEHFPHKVSEDIAVPRPKIEAFFEGAQRLGLPIATYGHLGDGNLHVNILGKLGRKEMDAHIMTLFRLVLELGGTITGEHGIGLAKRDAFLALSDPWQVQAIRAMKKALDPCGVFNAGKII
ncbi:MAG: FAD-binding oxidoreductase [Holophagales bacterium]|jgi:FAD/FMN-containing dehydrogenase|nr:FAD-binding oxidoreductase [Holophagales bacterium]